MENPADNGSLCGDLLGSASTCTQVPSAGTGTGPKDVLGSIQHDRDPQIETECNGGQYGAVGGAHQSGVEKLSGLQSDIESNSTAASFVDSIRPILDPQPLVDTTQLLRDLIYSAPPSAEDPASRDRRLCLLQQAWLGYYQATHARYNGYIRRRCVDTVEKQCIDAEVVEQPCKKVKEST